MFCEAEKRLDFPPPPLFGYFSLFLSLFFMLLKETSRDEERREEKGTESMRCSYHTYI